MNLNLFNLISPAHAADLAMPSQASQTGMGTAFLVVITLVVLSWAAVGALVFYLDNKWYKGI